MLEILGHLSRPKMRLLFRKKRAYYLLLSSELSSFLFVRLVVPFLYKSGLRHCRWHSLHFMEKLSSPIARDGIALLIKIYAG